MRQPRRIKQYLQVPAETAIVNAMVEVEKLPPNTGLTEAGKLLAQAKDLVSNYIDNYEL